MQVYDGAKTRVKVGRVISEAFKVKAGIRSPELSAIPFLLAIVIDVVT